MGASPDNVTSLRRMVRILAPGKEYQAMRKPLLAAVMALAVAPGVQAQPGGQVKNGDGGRGERHGRRGGREAPRRGVKREIASESPQMGTEC